MANPVWGELEKALDDNQTILEAIDEKIAAHEADEEAHLGAGEALQSHRASEIIDHAAGSVFGDKFSNKEFALNFPFESLDKYSKSVAGVNSDIAGFRLDTGSTINTARKLSALAQYSNNYYNVGLDGVFQFCGHFYAATNQLAYILAGGNGIDCDPPGVGFKVVNGTLYAVETVWGVEDFEEYTAEISGITVTSEHVYRVQYVAADNAAYFFVDGVLKTSLVLHSNEDVGLVMFSTYIKNTAAEQKQLWIHGVYFSQNPIS
ncbi:MAG: hypothetical protein WC310_05460 [Patescibacteria group bacterium]|jgi:hypothetical protein